MLIFALLVVVTSAQDSLRGGSDTRNGSAVNGYYSSESSGSEKSRYCGVGTVWNDNEQLCIATQEGILQACQVERGEWGFTCGSLIECDDGNMDGLGSGQGSMDDANHDDGGYMMWTFTIGGAWAASITESAGVPVMQEASGGIAVGKLNAIIKSGTITTIAVTSAIGQVFDMTADLMIGATTIMNSDMYAVESFTVADDKGDDQGVAPEDAGGEGNIGAGGEAAASESAASEAAASEAAAN